MASEQTNANKAIAQVVGEATRAATEVMAVTRAERTHNVRPRLDGPIRKQPTFNWEAEDKYNEIKNF